MVLKTFDNLDNIPVSKLRLIHLNMNSSNTANYGQTRLDTPEQINTKDGYALIGVAENTVILISPKLLWQGTRVEQMRPTTRPPRYMKVGTFDEKMFPSSRAVLGNIFSYKCVPFHV